MADHEIDSAPLDADEQLLFDLFRRLDCPSPVDPVDIDDCASMAIEIVRVLRSAGRLLSVAARVDVVEEAPDGLTHRYWSTHCRHDNHGSCSSTFMGGRLLDGSSDVAIERQPAQCKTCGSPCICPCHASSGSSEVSDDR